MSSKLTMQNVLIALLVGSAFMLGNLWTRVGALEDVSQGSSLGAAVEAPTPAAPSAPSAAAPTPREAGEVAPITDDDYIVGNRNAKIALIEYSDLECPFCQRFHATAQRLVDNNDGEVMWVYRHFPLTQLHPSAQRAAISAECAGKLGGNDAFWAFLDGIFVDQRALDTGSLSALASEIGVSQSAYDSCVEARETESLVNDDLNTGKRAGVTGTPGNIIINVETGESRLLPGALPLEQLQEAVDSLL